MNTMSASILLFLLLALLQLALALPAASNHLAHIEPNIDAQDGHKLLSRWIDIYGAGYDDPNGVISPVYNGNGRWGKVWDDCFKNIGHGIGQGNSWGKRDNEDYDREIAFKDWPAEDAAFFAAECLNRYRRQAAELKDIYDKDRTESIYAFPEDNSWQEKADEDVSIQKFFSHTFCILFGQHHRLSEEQMLLLTVCGCGYLF